MKQTQLDSIMSRYPSFFAFILLVIAIAINFVLQPNMLSQETLNNNLRVFLPIVLLTVGQAIVDSRRRHQHFSRRNGFDRECHSRHSRRVGWLT